MDYNELLDEAKRQNNLHTDYKLAQALGYKSLSTIYQVRIGKCGMKSDRLMKLLKMAGKSLIVVMFLGATLLQPSQDAHAANTQFAAAHQGITVYYVKLCCHINQALKAIYLLLSRLLFSGQACRA